MELDSLAALVGQWSTRGEVRLFALSEPLKAVGTNRAEWQCDRRTLVESASYDMGPLGTMTGMTVWTWNAHRRAFEIWWFDSLGEFATGWARFDEPRRIWRIRTVGHNGWCGVLSEGTINVRSDDRLDWTWRQWDRWRLIRIAEMRGTSTRRAEH